MGHYWSEMRGDETPQEKAQDHADALVKKLRKLPASKFTIDELALLLRTGWSQFQEHYHADECARIVKLAKRLNVRS